MKYSRRDLLRVAPAALAVATLPKAFGAEWNVDCRFLTREKFTSLVNAAFRVQFDSGASRWFTLLSVEDKSNDSAHKTFAREIKFISPGDSTPLKDTGTVLPAVP